MNSGYRNETDVGINQSESECRIFFLSMLSQKKMPPCDQMNASMSFMKPFFFLLGIIHVICTVIFIYSVPICYLSSDEWYVQNHETEQSRLAIFVLGQKF